MPGAEERQLLPGVDVPLGELGEVGDDLLLGQGGLEGKLAAETDAARNVGEQVVDRGDADRSEHRVPVAVGERELAHWSSSSAR